MQPPVFPAEFVLHHCPLVLEAREWRDVYDVPGEPEDDAAFAQCAFIPAGRGQCCENCELHLTRPFCGHATDEKFLPQIEKYYEDLAAYEKWAAEQETHSLTQGAGI